MIDGEVVGRRRRTTHDVDPNSGVVCPLAMHALLVGVGKAHLFLW